MGAQPAKPSLAGNLSEQLASMAIQTGDRANLVINVLPGASLTVWVQPGAGGQPAVTVTAPALP